MNCPKCLQWRSKGDWLPSQYHARDPDYTGRDRCRECWAKGPDEDAMAYMHKDEWLNDYIMRNNAEDQIKVFLKWHDDKKLRRGKDWSHWGALEWTMPRDQKDYKELNDADPKGKLWFDPGNSNYKQAVLFVDKTKRIENTTWLSNDEKMADIVEGLLGLTFCVERQIEQPPITDIKQRLFHDIPLTLESIASFWITVAKTIYHRNLVLQWFQSTHAKSCLVLQNTRKRKRDEEKEMPQEILCVELFNMVASLMQHFYNDRIRASDIETEVNQYIRKLHKDHRGFKRDSICWETIVKICNYVIREETGKMRKLDRIVGEWDHLLDLRRCRLRNRSHADAKRMPKDLTEDEVCECYYFWGRAFIEHNLRDEQKKEPKFIKASNTGHWSGGVKSFIRSMIHKHVGHVRLAVALWQRGLPLKALNERVSGAAEHGSHDVAGRTHLDHLRSDIQLLVDFMIAVGRAEADYRQKTEYLAAVRNSGKYRQSPEHAGNKEARRKLRAQLKRGEELVEQRDHYGFKSLSSSEQDLLHQFETNKLQLRLQELSKGLEPMPPFFRIV